MPEAGFYRGEARRCREQAAQTQDRALAERWRAMAREYDMLAEALDVQGHVARQNPKPQSQSMQQQQTKGTEKYCPVVITVRHREPRP